MHDDKMCTSLETIYVAGDIAGVEEASTAREEGRLSGIHAAAALGFYDETKAKVLSEQVWQRLTALRSGPFGEKRQTAKDDVLVSRGSLDESV